MYEGQTISACDKFSDLLSKINIVFFRIVGKLSLKKEIPKLRYNNRKSCNNNNNLYYKNVISVCIYFCLMSDHNA